MNKTIFWINDMSIEELEQVIKNGAPYIVIADHVAEKEAPAVKSLCAVFNPDNC
jgi:hypothetical protein